MTYQKITIPLDHGNRNMKTAEEVFTSGLVESDLKPVLGEYLQYNGKYYSLTGERIPAIMGDDYKVIIKTYLHPDEDNKYHCPSTILPPYEVILFVLKRFLTELSMKN